MSINISCTIKKFAEQGEKTGWTYVEIPAAAAAELKPNNKKSFRVKGKIAGCPFKSIALMPMGGGKFIMPLNAALRKQLRQPVGAKVAVQLSLDQPLLKPPPALMECLADEPRALQQFEGLPVSHRHYFIRWIQDAKTEPTIAKRIALAVNALAGGQGFAEMIRSMKNKRTDLG